MNRRQVLAGAASLTATSAIGVAGCVSFDDDGESTLGRVSLVNSHDESHTIDARIEWDGETVHESTHELEADSAEFGTTPAKTWPDEPGQFTLSARKDGGEWYTVDPADRDYPECYAVLFRVTENGRLSSLISTDEYECSEEALADNRDAASESGSS